MFTPSTGLSISSGALSFDRNARVKGQGRYSQNSGNKGADSSVARAFHLAEKISDKGSFSGGYNPNEDGEEGIGDKIVFGDAIVCLLLAKNTASSRNPRCWSGLTVWKDREKGLLYIHDPTYSACKSSTWFYTKIVQGSPLLT